MITNEGLPRAEHRARLRLDAENLIRHGADTAAEIGGGALGVEALALLYRRASDPDFAPDALKLLHELQTHQVELDLLLDQLQNSETELNEDLAHYHSLYQFAPVAYLSVSQDGRVIESNTAASALLGCAPEHSEEQTLTQYLALPSRTDVANLLERLKAPGSVASCKARLAGNSDLELSINASVSPDGELVMMVIFCCPASDSHSALS